MKAMKASICVAVTALALSLSVIVPSYAEQDEASRLNQESKELSLLKFVVPTFDASLLDDDVLALDVAKGGEPFPQRLHDRGGGRAQIPDAIYFIRLFCIQHNRPTPPPALRVPQLPSFLQKPPLTFPLRRTASTTTPPPWDY